MPADSLAEKDINTMDRQISIGVAQLRESAPESSQNLACSTDNNPPQIKLKSQKLSSMPALNSERAKSHANLDDLTSKLQQMHGK